MDSDSSAICSDASVGKLKELLRLESKSHQDTGQCYDTLQKEYDDLLRKYAEAENTIDKLRIDTLRERIERKEGNQDATEVSVSSNSIWKCLYEDLFSRTNKLQNAVSEFQAHLANHEFAGEELNDIFERLHSDFENITNAFQSMQALGNKVDNPNERYPEESLIAGDLEGDLYRLGLRLEEIQDEIGDQLRSTLKEAGSTLNIDDGKDLLAQFNDLGSPKSMDNDMVDGDWRPGTDDLSEMIFYRKMKDKDFTGIHPKYLSRSFSEPRNLQNSADAKTPINDLKDHACSQSELQRSREMCKNISNDSDVNKRKAKSPRKSPTHALNRLDLKSPSELPNDIKRSLLPSLNDELARPLSCPIALTSPEDSGYLEGSQPGQRCFPSRYPLQDQRNKNVLKKPTPSEDDINSLSAGEQYRKRLDSLRGYLNAKHLQNKPASLFENRKPAKFSSKKGRHKPASCPPLLSKLDIGPQESNFESSTTESVLSCTRDSAEEDIAGLDKAYVQRADIETLRSEIHGIRDIVLDLKESLTSSMKKPVDQDVHAPHNVSSMNKAQKDVVDASNGRNTKPDNNKLSQVHRLQNKQFEMLEKLEGKLDDIANEMHNTLSHQLRSPSQDEGHADTQRLSYTDRVANATSPNHLSERLDYYDNLYDEAFGDDKDIVETSSLADGDINDEFDTLSENCFYSHHNQSHKDGNRYRPASPCMSPKDEHRKQSRASQKFCHSNDCHIVHRNNPSRDRCVRTEDVSKLHRESDDERSCCCSGNHHNEMCHQENSQPCSRNKHVGNDSFNHLHNMNDSNIEEDTTPDQDVRHKRILDDSVNLYEKKFMEIAKQIDKLTSHIKNCKEKETKNTHDQLMKKHEDIVKTLEKKLEKLSSKIDKKEEKVSCESKSDNVLPGTMYLVACPICGCAGMHQHGSHVFNGVSLIRSDANTVANPIYVKPNVETNMAINSSNTRNALSNVATSTPKAVPNVMNLSSSTLNSSSTARPGSNLNSIPVHMKRKSNLHQDSDPSERLCSPNIYHHIHTMSYPSQDVTNGEATGSLSAGHYPVDLANSTQANRIQNSLEKASLAALHMENLSKKMLHGIANELFNSGPVEF